MGSPSAPASALVHPVVSLLPCSPGLEGAERVELQRHRGIIRVQLKVAAGEGLSRVRRRVQFSLGLRAQQSTIHWWAEADWRSNLPPSPMDVDDAVSLASAQWDAIETSQAGRLEQPRPEEDCWWSFLAAAPPPRNQTSRAPNPLVWLQSGRLVRLEMHTCVGSLGARSAFADVADVIRMRASLCGANAVRFVFLSATFKISRAH